MSPQEATYLSVAVTDEYFTFEPVGTNPLTTLSVRNPSTPPPVFSHTYYLSDEDTVIQTHLPRLNGYKIKSCSRDVQTTNPLILEIFDRNAQGEFPGIEKYISLEGFSSRQVFTACALTAAEKAIRKQQPTFNITQERSLAVTFVNLGTTTEIDFLVLANGQFIHGSLINEATYWPKNKKGLSPYCILYKLEEFPCDGSYFLEEVTKQIDHQSVRSCYPKDFTPHPERSYFQRAAEILKASLEFSDYPTKLDLEKI